MGQHKQIYRKNLGEYKMKFYSPLRYPGGKRKLIDYFKEVVVKNNLLGGTYVEPYAGGASIALSLLIDEYVSKIIINDLDRSIYAFWYSILNNTDEFCKLIKRTSLTIKVWKLQKKIQKEKNSQDLLSLGFSTFFLNRTNRSGILNAGVIGGLKQKGKWKINARYNKEDLINRIRKIAEYKEKIEIHNYDAINLIKELRKSLPRKTLFYFDPPYFIKGKELYMNHYEYENHKEIAIEIFKIKGQKWIVTYDNVPPMKKIYVSYNPQIYYLRYSAGNYDKKSEIMMNSKNILMPKINLK